MVTVMVYPARSFALVVDVVLTIRKRHQAHDYATEQLHSMRYIQMCRTWRKAHQKGTQHGEQMTRYQDGLTSRRIVLEQLGETQEQW